MRCLTLIISPSWHVRRGMSHDSDSRALLCAVTGEVLCRSRLPKSSLGRAMRGIRRSRLDAYTGITTGSSHGVPGVREGVLYSVVSSLSTVPGPAQ